MADNSYESGRLNLPFVGHSTFAKAPVCTDWDAIDADVAILGVPNDMGTQWRSGARFGPRGVREASTLFSFGHGGAYDFEDDKLYLTQDQVITGMKAVSPTFTRLDTKEVSLVTATAPRNKLSVTSFLLFCLVYF